MPALAPLAVALFLGGILALLAVRPAHAAGVVTDCTTYGPGPGTLHAALATDGLVTFACSGVIVLPAEIALGNDRHLILDGSGQAVTLSGGGSTRLFNLYRGASLHLRHLTLRDGDAGDAGGGAIMSGGLLTITNSSLLSNTATYGGALELFNGSAYIHNSTLAGNRSLGANADSGGGAIDQYFVAQGGDQGGGAAYDTPYVEIVQSTLVGNSAVVAGRGGVWQENGKLVIKQSIIAGNQSGNQSGDQSGSTSNCRIERPDARQFVTSSSLDDDGSCLSAFTADPLLAPLGSDPDDRGAPPTFALLRGSPAIDAAPADACAGTADERSALRPRDGDGDGLAGCDLGAYEAANRWLVLAAADEELAGYWKFDEGAGSTSVDSSGHGLNAALGAGASFRTDTPPLRFGSPFALAGGPGAQVPDAPPLNPAGELTLAAFVRLDADGEGGEGPVAAKLQAGPNGRGYGLLLADGLLAAAVWDSAGIQHVITAPLTATMPAGGWLHVALTYQRDAAMRLYVNGRGVGEQGAGDAVAAGPVPLVMGAAGAVDDVRLYSRALSPGAVAALASGRPCVTTGTTWADAVPDLQCALLEAGAGDEVWIGPGVYPPTRGPDRAATLAIGDGVSVYGGFAGTELRRDERTADTPRPVLSGDIGGDDRVDGSGVLTDPAALVGANALHVVTIRSTLTPAVTSTVLEAVTITGGQADDGTGKAAAGAAAGGCGSNCGGGLFIGGGAPQLRDLQLIGNRAAGCGGALYAEDSALLLLSAALRANMADSGGGACVGGGAPAVVNSLLAGNLASGAGGGVYSQDAALRLVNVTAAGNHAAAGGGLLLNGSAAGSASGSNLIVAGNTAGNTTGNTADNRAGSAGAQVGGSGAALQNSLVQDGCPPAWSCPDVQTGDPQFAAPALGGAPHTDGDYRLLPTSPVIDRGDNDAGLTAAAPAGATIAAVDADLGGAPRIQAARRLPAQVDFGAYEAANAPPLFTTAPITTGVTTLEYVYRAVAVDPNAPDPPLAITAVQTPPWLLAEPQADGALLLHGAPGPEWYGYFDVLLRAADALGVTTDQAFTIRVMPRVYSLYLPQVMK